MPLALLSSVPDITPPVLSPQVQLSVEVLLRERRSASRLHAAGMTPVRTVLLHGAPGVGKTMTAAHIASQLDLPLLTIDLATVMSSYLGRTGQNFRSALDYGRTHSAVVFLDEFDGVAKRRDDDSDIGELKRLVNVLLLELERWPASSLLIAATNHLHLLDRAVERRFDMMIEIPLPGEDERTEILSHAWPSSGLPTDVLRAVAGGCAGASGSALATVATSAAKRTLLEGEQPLTSLVREVSRRWTTGTAERDRLIRLLSDATTSSNRELASVFGVSHPTVAAALQRTSVVVRG
jgi:SpoVK/Ycf46/Vps4 family AAA+-type ATPase